MSRKRYYCTFFNKFYGPKFIALVHSMQEYCENYILYCVCIDDESYLLVSEMSNKRLIPIRWADYESGDTGLKHAKNNRSLVEYFFTCTASVCYYMLENLPDGELLTYLDADLYFYSTPEPIFKEIGQKAIGIIEHKWWGLGKIYKKYGLFNVGWISFRRNNEGRNCVAQWRNQCLEWCYDRLEDGKFADQKYLDEWPHKYKDCVCIISHPGANVAPWNVGQFNITSTNDQLYINDFPLIFFHFASFKKDEEGKYISRVGTYFTPMKGLLRTAIYEPYVMMLEENTQESNMPVLKRDGHTASFVGLLKNIFFRLRTAIYNDVIKV